MSSTNSLAYPPGPKGTFFGANLHLAIQRDPLGFMERLAREYGDVVHFRLGRRHVYLLNHPEHVKGVLLTHYANFLKGRGHARRDNFLGLGLVTSEGAFHRRQRQLTQPAFNHERLGAYGETMARLTAEAAAGWREGERLDVLDSMRQITLPIASQTLFGTRVDTEHERIIEAFRMGLNRFRWFKPSGSRLGDRLSPARRRRDRQSRETIETLVSEIIKGRRREDEDRGDLLSLLLSRAVEEGEQLTSDRQIRDEAVTLFIAGFENIATALTWTLYLLAQHPEVEERLHAELDGVLGGRLPGAEDIPRLAYTRMVLEEAMRVYPPVPRLVRTALRDYEVGGYNVPAGSLVVVSQYLMHRDSRFWEEPERFDPERFTPEAKRARLAYTYFPFGGGQRRCIGDGFAYMEGVLVLATLASRWRLRLDPRNRVDLLATHFLHPKGPLSMTAERRDAAAPVGHIPNRSTYEHAAEPA
jgi:cytochrome P450